MGMCYHKDDNKIELNNSIKDNENNKSNVEN